MSWYCCPNIVKPLIIKCQRESYKFKFTKYNDDVTYNESSMGAEGKSEDD